MCLSMRCVCSPGLADAGLLDPHLGRFESKTLVLWLRISWGSDEIGVEKRSEAREGEEEGADEDDDKDHG